MSNNNLQQLLLKWSGRRDSNPRPLRPERSALANCATSRKTITMCNFNYLQELQRFQTFENLCHVSTVCQNALPMYQLLSVGDWEKDGYISMS